MPGLVVGRHAAPVRAADVRRNRKRALQARRREDPLVPQPGHHLLARRLAFRCDAEGLICREAVRAQRRCHRREGLCWRGLFARDRARGNLSLFHRKNRSAGLAIEHEEHPCLRRLRDGGKRLAVARYGDERWRRGVVVVPQVVMHGLEVPHDAPGRRAKRDDGVRVAVVAGTKRAVIIRCGARRRHEDQVAGRIGRHDRPCVRCARACGASVAPGRERRVIRILWNRVPGPAQRACPRVERAHFAARGSGPRVVGDGGARDDQVADDERRRRHLIRRRKRGRDSQAFPQSDRAFDTERHAGVAGCAVERGQPRIDCRHVDPPAAWRARLQRRVDPRRDAAVGKIAEPSSWIDPRVVAPDLATGCRLQCHDLSERCADVHHVVYDDRGHLQRRLPGQIERRLARLISPRDHERCDVVARNTRKRRKSSAPGSPPYTGQSRVTWASPSVPNSDSRSERVSR